MTDREKLIDLLEQAESAVYWNGGDKTVIEKIADHLIANGVTFQRWIPVTERYPHIPHGEYGESEDVLTCNEHGLMGVLYFDGGCWCHPTGEVYEKPYKITHWMPLPEPPSGERKDDGLQQ